MYSCSHRMTLAFRGIASFLRSAEIARCCRFTEGRNLFSLPLLFIWFLVQVL